ncbi:MAG TPA: DUF305 domain-containing protein [Candidatus Peribacteraceae bacterium]|nr:DUF305 domain-containing protein [Candidatus Peribacteraceae bacterium]
MMDMMSSTGMAGFTVLWTVHILSVVLSFVGVLFLIVWAIKTFPPMKLKTWGIGLAVIGAVVCLFTIAVRGGPWIGGGFGHKSGMMMQRGAMEDMMDEMEEHDEREASDDHGGMMDMMQMMMGSTGSPQMGRDSMMKGDHDAMEMSMDDMSMALEGKTGDEFDQAFIEGMIPHHQGAIEMAVMALESAKHEEIKAMARAIISAQQQEIDQMEQWLKAWGYND